MGVCFDRDRWGIWKDACLPGTLRDGYRGSRNGASDCEGTQCGGNLGRAPMLGTLKDMLGLLYWEPDNIKDVILGAIWHFGKVIGLF
jgi:hypothetical protein